MLKWFQGTYQFLDTNFEISFVSSVMTTTGQFFKNTNQNFLNNSLIRNFPICLYESRRVIIYILIFFHFNILRFLSKRLKFHICYLQISYVLLMQDLSSIFGLSYTLDSWKDIWNLLQPYICNMESALAFHFLFFSNFFYWFLVNLSLELSSVYPFSSLSHRPTDKNVFFIFTHQNHNSHHKNWDIGKLDVCTCTTWASHGFCFSNILFFNQALIPSLLNGFL